jgi:hypothetical protein
MEFIRKDRLYVPGNKLYTLAPGLMPLGGSSGFPDLPQTGLTAHYDVSDPTTLFQTINIPGSPAWLTPAVADGDQVGIIKYLPGEPTGTLKNPNHTTGEYPLLRTSSPGLALQCIDFDGTNDHLIFCDINGGTLESHLLIAAGAKTVVISFRAEAFPGSGGFASIVSEANNEFGVYLTTAGGVTTVYFQNHDVINYHHVNSAPITVNTNYFIIARHDGVNVLVSLNGGTEVVGDASGNTVTLTGNVLISYPGFLFSGRIGEVAIYNIAVSGADLAQIITHMSRWL